MGLNENGWWLKVNGVEAFETSLFRYTAKLQAE